MDLVHKTDQRERQRQRKTETETEKDRDRGGERERSVHSPGQGRRLQPEDSEVDPWQLAPPCAGAGSVQERERDHVPSSQVVLQVPHELHGAHAPSTGAAKHMTIHLHCDLLFRSVNRAG